MIKKVYTPEELIDEKDKSYKAGFKEGNSHATPSIDTLKFMEKVNKELNEIKIKEAEQQKDIDYIRKDICGIGNDVKETKNLINDFIKATNKKIITLDKKYAVKNTEKKLEDLEASFNRIDKKVAVAIAKGSLIVALVVGVFKIVIEFLN